MKAHARSITLLALLLILMLATVWYTSTAQRYAGIGENIFLFGDGGQLLEIRIINGKEAGGMLLEVRQEGGTVLTLSGSELKAFDGQRIHAEVTTSLIEAGIQPSVELVDRIVSLVGCE